MEKFNLRLKRLRQRQGKSMREFANIVGVPESTYRDWEYGGSVRGQYYVRLAECLQISIHELLTGEQPRPHHIAQAVAKIDQGLQELKKALLT